MRNIQYIVVHCSATDGALTRPETILKNAKEKGEINPPYHKIIDYNGNITTFANDETICNGVKGYNSISLHVCYTGGVNGIDTRTEKQKNSLLSIIKEWKIKYPKSIIQGHRDFPEVTKDCPCFNAKEEYTKI